MFFLFLMIMSMLMLFLSMNLMMYKYIIMIEWLIYSLNSCNIYMTLIFDFMSMMFLSTVSFISSVVILYSGMYMENDKFINRFIYILLVN